LRTVAALHGMALGRELRDSEAVNELDRLLAADVKAQGDRDALGLLSQEHGTGWVSTAPDARHADLVGDFTSRLQANAGQGGYWILRLKAPTVHLLPERGSWLAGNTREYRAHQASRRKNMKAERRGDTRVLSIESTRHEDPPTWYFVQIDGSWAPARKAGDPLDPWRLSSWDVDALKSAMIEHLRQ